MPVTKRPAIINPHIAIVTGFLSTTLTDVRIATPAPTLRSRSSGDGKVKKRTLANITHWPAGKIEALRRLLRDEYAPHEPRADLHAQSRKQR